ncbi:Pentatricopeptide repeat-containing protein [Forsythia ovata]|uniref:Pentatricopeptide repeat-containing protein n=1 Tax=Forsythia ovata TaxID=205694 RepID=A0ABD1UVH0_9LAMI
MAIFKISRLILQKSVASNRGLSTVMTTEMAVTQKKKENSLFSTVSKLRLTADSETSIANTLDEWVNQGKPVKRFDIINLINYFRNRKNYQSALQLSNWVENSKIEMNNADRAIRIDLLFRIEGLDSAEKYFNSLQVSAKTNKTYGALLNCYCKEKISDKALETFEKMKLLSYTSTLNYNNLLSLHWSMNQPEKVLSLAQEMEEDNIAADIYTYNLLINSYASLKDIDAVEGVLEKMKRNKVKYDWFTYGNLATIYVNSGLHDKANAILEEMEKLKNQSDSGRLQNHLTHIKLYSQMNNLSGVNRAWESLKSTFPIPNNLSYLVMLLALSKLGDLEALEKCYKEWEACCSNYDFRLPNVMLEYYLGQNMIEEATAIHESLTNRGTEPNLRTLNSLTNLCLKNSQIDLAIKYLEMGVAKAVSEKHHWFPTDDTIKLFLTYFEEKTDVDRAKKFGESMKKISRLDSTVYDYLLSSNTTASNSVN